MNIIYAILVFWAGWGLYVLTMGLYRAHLQGRLDGMARILALPFVVVALVVDTLANLSIASLVFLDPPRELLVTDRLLRYMRKDDGWRRDVAMWICDNLLDPFDPSGNHC